MAQLTFRIQSGELTLPVLIGHSNPEAAALVAAGQPLPRPAWATGVIDTGTDVTCVAPGVLRGLGVSPFGHTSSQTAGGIVSVNLCKVSLSIPPAGNLPGPMLTRPDLIIMELINPIPGVEVLIGLDVLLECRLLLDGPGKLFTLEF